MINVYMMMQHTLVPKEVWKIRFLLLFYSQIHINWNNLLMKWSKAMLFLMQRKPNDVLVITHNFIIKTKEEIKKISGLIWTNLYCVHFQFVQVVLGVFYHWLPWKVCKYVSIYQWNYIAFGAQALSVGDPEQQSCWTGVKLDRCRC